MNRKEKSRHVAFVDEKIKRAFDKLKSGKFESLKLYKFINRAIDDLKRDPSAGILIPKRLIPIDYIRKYNVSNLWKYNLPDAWRLIYTIKENEVTILTIILEWLHHKEYERRFKY